MKTSTYPVPVAPQPQATSGWTAGRVVSLVVGTMLALGSLGLGAAGATLAVADATLSDDAGFLMTPDVAFASDTFAITSDLDVHADTPPAFMPDSVIGDAKLTVTADEDTSVFVGIASTEAAEQYLEGVRHDTFVELADEVQLRTTDGTAPRTTPTGVDMWVEQSVGTGRQELVWPVESGDWTVVVMNADGARGVDVDIAAGAEVPALEWLTALLLTLAGTGLVLAVLLVAVPVHRATRAG